MTDHALIALSPSWRGDPGYWGNERQKAILLYQYLKKLNYNIIFLGSGSSDIPYITDSCTRSNLLDALQDISNVADSNSNIIYYISDSPRRVIQRIPVIYRDFIEIFEERIQSDEALVSFIKTHEKEFIRKRGPGLSIRYAFEFLMENLPQEGKIGFSLENMIGFLEAISENQLPNIPEEGGIVEYLQKNNFRGYLKKNLTRKMVMGRYDEFSVPVSTIRNLFKVIMELYPRGYLEIRYIIQFLNEVYEHLHSIDFGYCLQLSPNFDLTEIVKLSEIKSIINNTDNKTMMFIGSGVNSFHLAKYFKSEQRITFGSMGEYNKGMIDHFNFANGLVRASYYNLKTYDKDPKMAHGKPIDPIKAVSLERIRLAKMKVPTIQNLAVFFDPGYLQQKNLQPVIPGIQKGASAPPYDPRIGAFVPEFPPPPPVLTELDLGGGPESGGAIDILDGSPPG